jgi:tetratricopeptide (TPR) repeat protein
MREMASIEVATGVGSIRRRVLRIGASVLMVTALVALAAQGVMSAYWERWLTSESLDYSERKVREWVEKAYQAEEAEDLFAAEQALREALSRTADPGRVAFHWGLLEYQRQHYREAELWFERVLADPECPRERLGRAWYNRGVCLLQRGGDASTFRLAIVCFQRALESGGLDAVRAADARYHLELAKQLWDEARRRDDPQRRKHLPPSSDEELPGPHRSPPPPDRTTVASIPGDRPSQSSPSSSGLPPPSPQGSPSAESPPSQAAIPQAGAGNLEPLRDTSTVQPLTPEDTLVYLRQTAERLKRDRQHLLRTLYGPARLDMRDW